MNAVGLAIDIFQVPSRVHFTRKAPLPDDLVDVLRIATLDEDAIIKATIDTGRNRAVIVGAARFFIEQILLHPDCDSYRALGGHRLTPTADLRRNVGLLMRCLHPDSHLSGDTSVFTVRVSRAWDDVKTEDRRLAYDLSRAR